MKKILSVIIIIISAYTIPAFSDDLKIGIKELPDSTEIFRYGTISSKILPISLMYEPLFYRAENASVEPGLAESWKLTDDITWEIKLRKNATFHDGTPLKAEHVVKSFELMNAPKQGSDFRYRFSIFQGIEKADDYTLKIITKRPYAPALYVLAKYLPIFFLKEYDSNLIRNGKQWPSGTGPYKLKNDSPYIELLDNDKYHGHKPYYKNIIFLGIENEKPRELALIKGEIDVATDISYESYPKIKESPEHFLEPQNQLMAYIGMNTNMNPLNDVRVRQAINYSINRKTINEKLFWGNATIAAGASSQIMLGFSPGLVPYSYSPGKAKKLLSEAGYPNGIKLKINYYQDLPKKTAEQLVMIKESLEASNIKAELQKWDRREWYRQLRAGNFSSLFMDFTFLDTEPELVLPQRFLMDPKQSYFYDTNIVERFMKAAGEHGVENRKRIYQDIDKSIREQSPWVFLYHYPTKFIGISKKVKHLEINKMASVINPVLSGRTKEYCINCVCNTDADCKTSCPKCW